MIERVQGGRWFADAPDGTPLGAFETRAAALAAIAAYEKGEQIVGRHQPVISIGPSPRGMTRRD